MREKLALFTLLSAALCAAAQPPRFEDYPSPANWRAPAVPVKLITPSERMFRTRLTEAARQPPNFAGHYRITYWGCGSNCAASAVIDLETGNVYPPPLGAKGPGWDRWASCIASFDGTGDDFRLSSKLMIVRCGLSIDENGKNRPDVNYFLWEANRFRELQHIRAKESPTVH
jgi:hypothetical protein